MKMPAVLNVELFSRTSRWCSLVGLPGEQRGFRPALSSADGTKPARCPPPCTQDDKLHLRGSILADGKCIV
jgi:hypothetical protein